MPQLDINSFPHQLNTAFFWLLIFYMMLSLSIAPKIFSILLSRILLIDKEKFDGWKGFFRLLKNLNNQKNLQKYVVASFEGSCFEKIALLHQQVQPIDILSQSAQGLEDKLRIEELHLKVTSILEKSFLQSKK